MAWTRTAEGTGIGSKISGNTLTANASFDFAAGEIMVVVAGGDNVSSTDGNTNEILSVVDSKGNTYTKIIEFCNSQGGAANGAVVAVFASQLTSALISTDTITINYANNIVARGFCSEAFTVGAGSTWSVEGTNQLANDGVDPGSLDVTTPNQEFLRIRATVSETSVVNFDVEFTRTSGWDRMSFSGNGTSGAGDASNISVWAEFHISSGTGDASDPAYEDVDAASVYVVLKEVSGAASSYMGGFGGWF